MRVSIEERCARAMEEIDSGAYEYQLRRPEPTTPKPWTSSKYIVNHCGRHKREMQRASNG